MRIPFHLLADGGGGADEIDAEDDDRRAMIAQVTQKPHAGAARESAYGYHPRQLERSRTTRLFL